MFPAKSRDEEVASDSVCIRDLRFFLDILVKVYRLRLVRNLNGLYRSRLVRSMNGR